MILWSLHTFWYKGSAENNEKCQVQKKASFSQNIAALAQRLIFPNASKINEIDNSQMHCKCYTRYKSNPMYQLRKIENTNRNPTIIGNFDFAYFREKSPGIRYRVLGTARTWYHQALATKYLVPMLGTAYQAPSINRASIGHQYN